MPETLEDFLRRAAGAGIYEFWVSCGGIVRDLPIIHISPKSYNASEHERCVTHEVSTKTFRVAGNVLWPDMQTPIVKDVP